MSNRLSGDCSIPKFFVPYLTPADVTERLHEISPSLAAEVKTVLDVNKAERHIRGGLATREKYHHSKENL
ncbi:MAG: sporulation transcriptional regulator SpoIIID [Firmicutes bacterium]|nr:sporulation transcriptional regulator SpoIIID [Bacillota bacterium]